MIASREKGLTVHAAGGMSGTEQEGMATGRGWAGEGIGTGRGSTVTCWWP